ncbi:MAG TPA: VWA domain-containing protein, partial [Pyrinomonadaceae bacterium]
DAPPAPAGTRDVSLRQAGESAGDWATVRHLSLVGRAGAVIVPPGTYGRFAAGSHTALVFGVAGSSEPAIYNLESLQLSGGSELRLDGPVTLTVKSGVTLTGSTVGAADDPRRMLLKMPEGELKIGGSGVLYGVVRAPHSLITVEGNGRLRGTVSCDRLAVNGNGVLQITENDLPPPRVNRPPAVDAGADQAITLPTDTVSLQGAASDDGLPQGSTLSSAWSKVSGPGTVSFSNAGGLAATASFTQAGTYVLRLTASDTLLTGSDEVTVTVIPRNRPPAVNAGEDRVVTLPAAASLAGTVADDGLPRGSVVAVTWSVVEGPGAVVFADPNSAATTASFGGVGAYTLRLTASDTEFDASDDVVITVNSVNLPPVVNAGPDQMITPPNNTLRLNGVAADDGRPAGVPPSVTWSQVSGPAPVGFGDAASAVATATFNDQGTYVLRLTASDSQFAVSDEVEVVVGCPDNLKNLDVVLVIDRSGSMEGKRIADAKIAAKSFIDNLQLAVDQVGVVTFAGSGRLDQPLTRDGARAKAAVDAIPTEFTGTNIGAGITVARNELIGARHNPNSAPIMIVLSDGENNAGDPFAPAAAAQAAGIRVVSIGIAEAVPADMRRLASTPTDFYFAPSSEDLEWIYAVIAGSVCRNAPPLVRAGEDFAITLPNAATLNGEAHDDGLPANSRLTSTWSLVSGPAAVNIFDVNAPLTPAVFDEPGTYVLRLTATDSIATGGDEVTVTVHPEPSPEHATLTLTAGGAGPRVIGTPVTLSAILSNGGVPLAGFGVRFTVSGPNATAGTVFTDSAGAATFTYTGTDTGTDTADAAAAGRNFAARSNPVTLGWTTEPPSPDPSPASVPSTTQGWIGAPLDRSFVSGLVPITVGAGVTLSQGTVEYRPVSDPGGVKVLTTTARGGPGTTVATLDTTLLANGSYFIRLRGTRAVETAAAPGTDSDVEPAEGVDSPDGSASPGGGEVAGQPTAAQSSGGEELVSQVTVVVVGENKPGRMGVSATDFSVPVSGLPITVGRTYDSLERGRVGDFGHGWSLSIGSPRLEVNPAGDVTLTELGTGRRVTFKFTPKSFGGLFSLFHYPAYTPEPGVYGSLISDGCTTMLRLGGAFTCALSPSPYYLPTVYQYTDPQGRTFTITADGVLRSIKDLNGNVLTFDAAGITGSAGLNIPFTRDAWGRITEITDPLGNVYRYAYDAAGDLSSVNLPGLANPIAYAYDAGHLYRSSTDPRGNTAVVTTYYPDGRVETFTDAAGHTTGYAYDLTANTTTTTNPDGGVVVERRDGYGLLLGETDALGHTTSYAYDGNRNLVAETNALGQTTRYTYDANGNRTSVTDPLGRTSRAAYNRYGGPATLTDELGHVRTILYDANYNPVGVGDGLGTLAAFTLDRRGNPLTLTDGGGATTHFTYDTNGNLLTRTDPLGHTTTYAYDRSGRLLVLADPRANTTRNAYDALGRLLTVTDALGRVTRYAYDANGNRTLQTDALARRTASEYDAANRLTKVTFHNGTSVSYTYDFRGRRLTETDQAGRTTTHTYDKAGRLVRTRYADGSGVTFAYDAIGRIVAETDERGHTTHYEYDPACGCSERLGKVTDALGRVTTYRFDAAGRPASITDAAGRETGFAYDARGQLLRAAFADGTSVRQAYDGAGRLTAETDQAGSTTRYAYDAAGRLLAVTDALDRATRYGYDAAGNLLSVTDANAHTTAYEYDKLNRVTRRTLPLGQSETYGYDFVGNLTSRIDFNGKRTTYIYDALNRLTNRVPDGTLGEPSVTFNYTATGRRARMTDAAGVTTYAYDLRDRLISKATPRGALSYTYDAAGNVLTVRSSNADGLSVDYAYDEVSRLASVTDNRLTPGTTTYSYDATDNLIEEVAANGVRTAYGYDAVDNLMALTVGKGGAALAGYSYTYGPAGHRQSVAEAGGRRVGYTYDAAHRLTGETITGAADAAHDGAIGYTLDPVGNRLARASTVAALALQSFGYDADDRLTTHAYDANGNTTQANGQTYAYDSENRLKGVGGGAVTFLYDGDGNRVAKTVGGVTTRYLIDESNPTGYPQVVEEAAGGGVQRRYAYGLSLLSQSRLVGGAWAASFYGADGHGTVRLLTDASGALTDTYDYDTFGNLLSHTGATQNDYLYSGERFDAATGLYHLRARDYDPQAGRFRTPDSFPGFLDLPRTLHDYSYVGADPVNYRDPSGLIETTEYKLRGTVRPEGAIRIPCFLLQLGSLSEKVIVIGESMDRVKSVGKLLGATVYNTRAPASWPNNSAWLRRY